MTRQLFLTFFCAVAMTPMMAQGSSAPAKDNTATLPPMFVFDSGQNMMQMVYWTYTDEPQKTEDNAEFYEEEHQDWALQEKFRRNVSQYTKLIVDHTQTRDVKYVDELLLNPDGEKLFPGELHSRDEIPSPGIRFSLVGKPLPQGDELPGSLIVTDSYLATHKPMSIKPTADRVLPLRFAVIKQMEQKYGMKVEKSSEICSIGGRYTYGVLQFKGEYNNPKKNISPDMKAALALEIITDGDKIYSYPVEGWYLPEEGPIWNADDGGEYFPSQIAAAFEGPQGPEFYCIHWAPESATTGKFLISDNQLNYQRFAVYHSLVDEQLPVWKKDIEEMKRLYVEEDPGENREVELTKWAHVYIDYDGEQIWISDDTEENGAFFSRENGKLKLIAVVRANLKPSFPESRDGNNYLVISGPAGGPSYYTEIYKLKNGKVIEEFNGLEIYGELDSCVLNGKEISAEQGKAYMKAVPEAREPFIFWQEINP